MPAVNPAGKVVRYPVGLVILQAGEHEACLCDAVAATEIVVRNLERSVLLTREKHDVPDAAAGADLVLHL